MDNELYRLASFNPYEHVQESEGCSILTLARKGFYYDISSNSIICNNCKKEYRSTKDRFCEHEDVVATPTDVIENPTTTFLSKTAADISSTLSVIPDTLRNVYDACQRRASKATDLSTRKDVGSQQSFSATVRSVEQPRTTDTQIGLLSSSSNASLSQTVCTSNLLATFDVLPVDHASILQHYQERLRSFVGTPSRVRGPSVEELAWYGWRYDGNSVVPDRVKCVYCKGALRDWNDDDEADVEHTRWFANCTFMKVVQAFPFQGIRRKEQIALNNHMSYYDQPLNPVRLPSVHAFDPREVKARMDTTMARTILDMGYTKDCVRQVIEERLKTAGDDFPSIAEFMDAVLTKAEQQGASGPLGASNWKPNLPSTATAPDPVLPQIVPGEMSADVESSSIVNTSVDDDTFTPSGKKRRRRKREKQKKENEQQTPQLQSLPSSTSPNRSVETLEQSPLSSSVDKTNDNEDNNNDFNDEEYSSLLVENKTLKDARLCKICMELEVNIVFLPCGHLVSCHVCSPKVRNCPLCRTFIRGTVKTFLS